MATEKEKIQEVADEFNKENFGFKVIGVETYEGDHPDIIVDRKLNKIEVGGLGKYFDAEECNYVGKQGAGFAYKLWWDEYSPYDEESE